MKMPIGEPKITVNPNLSVNMVNVPEHAKAFAGYYKDGCYYIVIICEKNVTCYDQIKVLNYNKEYKEIGSFFKYVIMEDTIDYSGFEEVFEIPKTLYNIHFGEYYLKFNSIEEDGYIPVSYELWYFLSLGISDLRNTFKTGVFYELCHLQKYSKKVYTLFNNVDIHRLKIKYKKEYQTITIIFKNNKSNNISIYCDGVYPDEETRKIIKEGYDPKKEFAISRKNLSIELGIPFRIALKFKGKESELTKFVDTLKKAINIVINNPKALEQVKQIKGSECPFGFCNLCYVYIGKNYNNKLIANYAMECINKKQL